MKDMLNEYKMDDKEELLFPQEAIPEYILKVITNVSSTFQVPFDVSFYVFMATIGSLLGAFNKTKITETHLVSNNFYLGIVGNSGSGKSPIIKYLAGFIRKVDSELNKQSLIADDVTPEALFKSFEINTNGLLVIKEELITFLTEALRTYNSGRSVAKERLTQLYDGDLWKKERAGELYGTIENPLLTIIGGLTPQRFITVFNDSEKDSGLMQRFFFVNMKVIKRRYPTSTLDKEDAEFLENLYQYTFHKRPTELTLKTLTADAKECYLNWFNMISEEIYILEKDYNVFAGFLSKHREYPVKFASILHHIDNFFHGRTDLDINADCMRAGIMLTDFARMHTQAAWSLSSKTKIEHDEIAIYLLRYIKYLKKNCSDMHYYPSELATKLNEFVKQEYGVEIKTSSLSVGKKLKKLGFKPEHTVKGNLYDLSCN